MRSQKSRVNPNLSSLVVKSINRLFRYDEKLESNSYFDFNNQVYKQNSHDTKVFIQS